MIGILRRDNVRGVLRTIGRRGLDALPARGLSPLLYPITDRLADTASQIPCAIADLVFLPPVSNCAKSAPERGDSSGVMARRAPAGHQLRVRRNGSYVATIVGTGSPSFTWYDQNPRVIYAPGSFLDGRIDPTSHVAIYTLDGQPTNRNNSYPLTDEFVELDLNGNPVTTSNPNFPNGLTPGDIDAIGRQIRDALDDSDPCACFDPDSDFWPNLRKALESLLGGGSGIPGDRDGDGIPDIQDPEEPDPEEDPEKDKACDGKGELAQLFLMVKTLHKFLGGEEFGNDRCDPKNATFTVNPESLIRQFTEQCYEFQVQEGKVTAITPSEIEVKSLPQLLAALLAVGYTRSGQWRYPSSVKDSIVKSDGGILGILFNKENQILADQQAYHQWFLEQFDATMGSWQQKIEIVDSDLEQPGNQSKTIRLPNVAEAIAELFVLVYDTKLTNDVLLNMLSRSSMEVCAIKSEAVQTKKWAELIADYLGPKIKEKKAKLPLLFTLLVPDGENPSEANIKSRNSLSKFLETSEKEIVIAELGQPDTLQKDLLVFRQASAVVMASLAKKFGKNTGIYEIAESLINSVKLAAKVIGDDEVGEDADGPNDFSKFLQDVEAGFVGSSGITDSQNPYGRPFDQRPQIREIGREAEDS
jgi:hypothetical protein